MREVRDPAELARLCGADTLCLWVAQGLPSTVRAWRSVSGDAVVVACPDLSLRDRLLLHGDAAAVSEILSSVLPHMPSSYRVMGRSPLVAAAADANAALQVTSTFGWMDRRVREPDPDDDRAEWLGTGDAPEIARLLDVAFPDSYARPGVPGVGRWSGLRRDGRITAVAASAWSSPEVGFIAGVAAHPDALGSGAAAAAFSRVLSGSLSRGAAALMVTAENTRAIRLYRGFGMAYRSVSVAAIVDGRSPREGR